MGPSLLTYYFALKSLVILMIRLPGIRPCFNVVVKKAKQILNEQKNPDRNMDFVLPL